MSHLNYDERDVLKTILRYHGLADNHLLEANLEDFVSWVHDVERAKIDRNILPKFPLVLLGMMGIHGRNASAKGASE